MLDRTQAPQIRPIQNINIPEIEVYNLPEGRSLYVYREPNTNAFKIEILTEGGNINGRNSAEVQLGLKILAEGTLNRTSHQISEHIDSIGSFLELSPGFDNSSLSIYGLTKFFPENIAILSELLYQPLFSDQSLKVLKEKEKDKLRLNLEKGSYISSTNLRKTLFGNHPYGYSLSFQDLENISIADLHTFHSEFLQSFDIYLSGDIPESFLGIIQEGFTKNSSRIESNITSNTYEEKYCEYRNPKFIQSSIKIGRRLFNRSHQDYFKFIVANEYLGGFFGSRLMKNIREDKGYTYGIYSALYPLKHQGYFLISTDVKGENEQETLQEIQNELDRLANKLVANKDLDVVKSYMIGTFVNSFSTPFAPITKFKTVNTQSLNLNFYKEYIEQIRAVSANDLLEISQKYLNYNSLTISLAGG